MNDFFILGISVSIRNISSALWRLPFSPTELSVIQH
jgi:hypothetical protein